MENNILRLCSPYETCIQAQHYCGDDESVSPTSSLKPKTKKALVYQEMINDNAASLLFFPDTFRIITSAGVLWQALCMLEGLGYVGS